MYNTIKAIKYNLKKEKRIATKIKSLRRFSNSPKMVCNSKVLNILNMLYCSNEVSIPVGFEIIKKDKK